MILQDRFFCLHLALMAILASTFLLLLALDRFTFLSVVATLVAPRSVVMLVVDPSWVCLSLFMFLMMFCAQGLSGLEQMVFPRFVRNLQMIAIERHHENVLKEIPNKKIQEKSIEHQPLK